MILDVIYWVLLGILLLGGVVYALGYKADAKNLKRVGGIVLVATAMLLILYVGIKDFQTKDDEKTFICSYCEEQIEEDYKYCPECGMEN